MKKSSIKEKQGERRAFALQLRKDGHSYEKIGRLIGSQFGNQHPGRSVDNGCSAVYARKLVYEAIKDIYRDDAMNLVRLEMERLDDMQLECVEVLRTSHVVISNGSIMRVHVHDENGDLVMDEKTGLPQSVTLRDDGPRLAAIDRLLKIQERRSKLLGLDKPTKVAQTDPEGKKAVPTAVIMVSETDAKL